MGSLSTKIKLPLCDKNVLRKSTSTWIHCKVICIFKTENDFVVNSERGASIFVDNDLLGYKLSCCGGFGLFFSFAQNAFDPTVPGWVSMPIAYAILYILTWNSIYM